ncbi:MAG: CRISPR-associated protein Csn1, partial [Alistipes sp.]|nr:CRISPR-associated protein Csn1 [Alistipes sp.]
TKINIEFSRMLNDANKRKAIEQYQRERETEHRKYADEIRQQYAAATGSEIEPTETDILKYRLWEEQKHVCPYTGALIGISDFLGSATRYDIEHTLPRSRGGDDSQMNKTLCDNRFNREVKRAKLPAELSNHEEILARIEQFGWQERIDSLQKQIEAQVRKSRGAATKSEKDKAIQNRHYLQMQYSYWRGKLERFTMTEVPEGFSNRQGVDIGIIGRYARLYLKTVFEHIYTVKGATTDAFRKMWGLQEEYTKKERVNHVHHCIDAITIACIGRNEYAHWAQYASDEEQYRRNEGTRPQFEKPWPTFTEDVKAVADELLISHHTPDNLPKQSRKRLRIRGKVQLNDAGAVKYQQGDTARGKLHLDTFYGAIKRDDEIKYVIRKSLNDLKTIDDVEKIVDEAVKQKVKDAIEAVGFKKAMNPAEHTIWMNEEKQVPIRKVRIFAVKKPKPLGSKTQRDSSIHEYKRPYYITTKNNYCITIYEGTDMKGRTNRSFEIVSNLEAAQYFKASADRTARPDLVPLSDANGYPLKYILKPGTMVLFYKKSPEELHECSQAELAKRLYKVVAMSVEGRIQFLFHQEAREQTTLGPGIATFDADHPVPKLRLSISGFNAYVEGYDFELTVAGELKFKHRPTC